MITGAANPDDLMSIACYAQPRVNPYLYIYALTVAVLHRNDTRGMSLPPHVCTFPELYIDGTVMAEARSAAVLPDGYRVSFSEMSYRAFAFMNRVSVLDFRTSKFLKFRRASFNIKTVMEFGPSLMLEIEFWYIW